VSSLQNGSTQREGVWAGQVADLLACLLACCEVEQEGWE